MGKTEKDRQKREYKINNKKRERDQSLVVADKRGFVGNGGLSWQTTPKRDERLGGGKKKRTSSNTKKRSRLIS